MLLVRGGTVTKTASGVYVFTPHLSASGKNVAINIPPRCCLVGCDGGQYLYAICELFSPCPLDLLDEPFDLDPSDGVVSSLGLSVHYTVFRYDFLYGIAAGETTIFCLEFFTFESASPPLRIEWPFVVFQNSTKRLLPANVSS